MRARDAELISFTSLYSNSLSQSLTVTTVFQAGLYSMGCPNILRSVVGCGNSPLSKAGQLVQQCTGRASSDDLSNLYHKMKTDVNNNKYSDKSVPAPAHSPAPVSATSFYPLYH